MKSIYLWVGGERFIVEDCEGRPEIRKATAPRAHADRTATATLTIHGAEYHIELKVEGRSD